MFRLQWSVAHGPMRENVFAATDAGHFSLPAVRDRRGSGGARCLLCWRVGAGQGTLQAEGVAQKAVVAGERFLLSPSALDKQPGRGACLQPESGWGPLGGGRGSPCPREDASGSFLGLQPIPSLSPALLLFHRLFSLLPACMPEPLQTGSFIWVLAG